MNSAGKCPGQWSGNWLNWATTSRMDAVRKVLYGGYRDGNGSDNSTILRRAYVPQDAHSWAKEYTSEANDGYNIADYTPLTAPVKDKKDSATTVRRHFFGNLTRNKGGLRDSERLQQ
jgi:type IV pilus assembly protein PilY1